MADGTHIQWTEATWNPFVGCTAVSPGCDHCYAAREASGRLSTTPTYAGLASGGVFNGTVRLLPERLGQPLRWRKPRRIFVNSMSDLFHEKVPDEFIGSVFDVMATTTRHTYQILTKRHGRMRSLLNRWAEAGWTWRRSDGLWCGPINGPLPNVWLGVSVEDQQWADIRIPALLDTPAAVRWISAEPLLGPVDLGRWLADPAFNPAYRVARCGQLSSHSRHVVEHGPDQPRNCPGTGPGYPPRPTWVVVGGESGPGARPMNLDWARSLVGQCQAAGVAPFVKQLGSVWARSVAVLRPVDAGRDPKGGDIEYFPDDLQVREYPELPVPLTEENPSQ